MYCTNCGYEMDPNASFCVKCGCKPGKVQHYCWNCGAAMNENADFCTTCGCKAKKASSDDLLSGFSGGTRQKLVAALLALFLGCLGIHDFYLGYKKYGIIKIICTITGIGAFITSIWALIDLIQILTGKKLDADGNELI